MIVADIQKLFLCFYHKLFFQKKLHFKLNKFEELTSNEKQELLSRLNYYNQLKEKYILSQDAKKLSEIKLQKNHKTYYFDRFFHS